MRYAALIFALAVGAAGDALAADPATTAHGQQLYQYWCATCHGAGPGFFGPNSLPGTMALALKYQGKEPPLLEQRTDLTADSVRYFVRHGVQAMPYFRKTEISDADLDAIAAYLAKTPK